MCGQITDQHMLTIINNINFQNNKHLPTATPHKNTTMTVEKNVYAIYINPCKNIIF